MPTITIPRIVRPIDLARYAPELAPQIAEQKPPIFMWVNLPRRMAREWNACSRDGQVARDHMREAIAKAQGNDVLQALEREAAQSLRRVAIWWSEAWSQGDPDTHWTPEAVEEFVRRCSSEDPALWEFIAKECWALVTQHRESARKN